MLAKKRRQMLGVRCNPTEREYIKCTEEYDSDDYAESDIHSEVDGNDTSMGEISFDEDDDGSEDDDKTEDATTDDTSQDGKLCVVFSGVLVNLGKLLGCELYFRCRSN